VRKQAEPARRRAREAAFRVAYQADVTRDSYTQAWEARRTLERLSPDQSELVEDIVHELDRRAPDVDRHIEDAAEQWAVARLSATDRSILRAAIAELIGRPGTPARVVLDEAIELAKRYGSEESGRFVNGVLDRVARSLRPEEFS
jgi:N utilization substance protein B